MKSNDLNGIKDAIKILVKREYDEELLPEAFDDLTRVGIAETNDDDREDITISVVVNIPTLSIDMYLSYDGIEEKTDTWQYFCVSNLIYELERVSFDDLVSLGPNAELRIADLSDRSAF